MTDQTYTKGRRTVNRRLVLRAPAKVNLHLEVLRRRHDGFHDVETVLQAVRLFDRVTVDLDEQRPGGPADISLSVSGVPGVPADDTNLCWQAAVHFCRKVGVSGTLRIHLEKEIPAAAGLGGGSSDAAAVLVACDRLFDTRLDQERLESLAGDLGSDVPFFIAGGTALARGRGTRLTRLTPVQSGQFLIIRPHLNLSTSEVYEDLKMGLTVNSPKANIQVIKSILARFPQKTWPGFNRLEDVVLPTHPLVQRMVLRLRELEPVAMLSGSGSAVFAVFPDDYDMTPVAGEFEQAGLFVRAVGPFSTGVQVLDP
ncbi:4-(cytidine 5'-diphospho)-2-C-methyl-D-erythritol kinase [bacterium]|nr:MAG: 4-(cytidine 5'-diphospho)-2-C-methyl-D-erythritol kinase [bacterium]